MTLVQPTMPASGSEPLQASQSRSRLAFAAKLALIAKTQTDNIARSSAPDLRIEALFIEIIQIRSIADLNDSDLSDRRKARKASTAPSGRAPRNRRSESGSLGLNRGNSRMS